MTMKKWGPSPEEYGLSNKDQLTKTDDKSVVKLLVAKGGYLDWDVAVKYGLVDANEETVAAPAEAAGAVASPAKPATARGSLDLRKNKPTQKAASSSKGSKQVKTVHKK